MKQRLSTIWILALVILPVLGIGGFAILMVRMEVERLLRIEEETLMSQTATMAEALSALYADYELSVIEGLTSLAYQEGSWEELNGWKDANPFVGEIVYSDPLRIEGAAAVLETIRAEKLLPEGLDRMKGLGNEGAVAVTNLRTSLDEGLSGSQRNRLELRQQSMYSNRQLEVSRSTGQVLEEERPVQQVQTGVIGDFQSAIYWVRAPAHDQFYAATLNLEVLKPILETALRAGETDGLVKDAQGDVVLGGSQDHSASGLESIRGRNGKTEFERVLTGRFEGYRVVVAGIPSLSFRQTAFSLSLPLVILLIFSATTGGFLLWRDSRRSRREALEKSGFVASVSHELKTPLTTIRMYAEMLEEGRVRSEERKREYMAAISDETQRLTRLINNVLGFSRLEEGAHQAHLEEIIPAVHINKVVQLFMKRADDEGYAIDYEIDETVQAKGDPDALEQVLINLIDNALKYDRDGRRLDIRHRSHCDWVEIVFQDYGGGISTDDGERVFTAFWRADTSITSAQPGTGLGLSISRRLMKAMGGELLLENTKEKGARFVLRLQYVDKPKGNS